MFLYSFSILICTILTMIYITKMKKTKFSYLKCFLLFLVSILSSILIEFLGYQDFHFTKHISLYLLSFFMMDSLFIVIFLKGIKNYIVSFFRFLFFFLILELFVFNFRHFESTKYKEIDSSSIEAVGLTEKIDNETFVFHTKEDISKKETVSFDVQIKHIDEELKNVYIDAYLLDSEGTKLKVLISATDEANKYYFSLPSRVLVPNVKETKYMRLHLSGKTNKMKFTFSIKPEHIKEGSILKINKISFNKTSPLNIYFMRSFLLSFACVLFLMIKPSSKLWKMKLDFSNQKQKLAIFSVIVLEMMYLTITTFSNGAWLNNDRSKAQVEFHKLAVALKEGHFYLNDPVPESLKELDNPYDTTLRKKAFHDNGEFYLWDYAYYNEKYYVYFGIVPVLIAYLPLSYLIGDFVLPNFVYIYAMGMLIVFASYFLLKEVVGRFFKNIPTLLFIILWLFFINASQLPYMMHRPDFYSIPIITAFMFTLSGLYLWLSSTRGKMINKKRMIIGSLCMALVAGCRPQFLVGSFFCFPIFYSYFKDKKLFTKENIKNIILFCIPYIIVAIGLMYYNYARFGSIFDFGANYNLTTNDMTKRGFVLGRIPLGIYTYLFEPLNFSHEFPFIKPAVIETNYLGKTISENFLGGAISVNILLILSLFVFKFKKYFKNKRLYTVACMSSIMAILVIIMDTEMAGILPRYLADFTWLLLFSTILIILTIYSSIKEEKFKEALKVILVSGLIITLLYSFFLIFVDITYSLCNTGPYIFYKIYSIFMFFL